MHTLCAIIGFAVTVQWGITAVAMSYVIISYLLAPLPFVAMRRLIRIDTGTYLRQLWAPVLSTACMAVFIYAIRAAVEDNIGLHPLLLLYIVGGAIIYVGAINLTCPSYARQATKLARLTFSRAKSI